MDVVSPILEKAGATYVINKLIDAATTYVRDQYYWKTDLQEELQSLRRLLPQIQAVVGFAEDRLTSNESSAALTAWLWQFRDGIGEAEEVLDELEYLELEKKANSDKSRLSRTVDASVKAAKRLLKFDDVLGRLKTCVKNLNTSASDVGKFLAMVTQTGGMGTGQMQQGILPLSHQSRITSSLPVLSFKGREEEKRIIIQYLLGESVEESEIQISQNVNCLPLVAMGGMGKTALAKQVFDYFKNVKKEHFDIKIWVCDSLPDLDASSLMKKILEGSTGRSESMSLERLPVKLEEELRSKRFLLVLDDAWDDKNQTQWENLCAPLLHGQKGSWILLTTRLRSVAKMVSKEIKGTMMPMMLQGLSKDECRSLLYERAFSGQDQNGFPLLKEIGEEIVGKLDGVPLLAKSIGGALNNKLEADHWTNISRSELWKTPFDSRCEFSPILTLSYVMLPPRLKRCFSYCSIFPQDYHFKKQKLVSMWLAAGLIYSEGSEEGSDEGIANSCFDILCNKSFFDFHPHNWWKKDFFYDLGADYYTMHDMLNSLACHVSRYECCRIMHSAPSRSLDYNAIRHISITSSTDAQLQDLTKMVCKFQHLQTLWIQYYGDPQKLDDFIRDACKSPRKIRVLILEYRDSSVSYQFLKSISDFVKIRFLEISPILPSLSMGKFYFLQVLICNSFRSRLAKDTNKLTNLRHLYQVPADALFSVAKVGKLTSLQELCFTVGTEPGYRIDELMNMDDIRELSIQQLSNVRSLEEVNMVNLVEKHYLTRLELKWNSYGVSNPDLDQQDVLAALQPYTTIRELTIKGYKGGRAAPWMDTSSLSWLEDLQLYDCTRWVELPPLWKLPCLKFLKLVRMIAIRSFGCPLSERMDIQFPILEELEFSDLPLLEEWTGADEYIWFPHLKSFIIHDCPKLKKIPDLPLSIEHLKIKKLGLEALPRFYKCSNGFKTFGGFQQLMSLKSLEIYNHPGIAQIGSIGEEDDNILSSSLETLELENIDEHKDLTSYQRGLTLLTKLHLHCFPSLESLPKFLSVEVESEKFLKDTTRKHAVSSSLVFDQSESNRAASILPSSLESLEFENSDISHESLGRCLQGLISLKNLKISDCHHLVSLPNVEYLHNLTALQSLDISDCKELCELESLTALVSLRELHIYSCPKLVSLPNVEYLHNLTALRSLMIRNCEELCELESLTALASLRQLYISSCPKLVATTFSNLQNSATATEQSATKKKKGTLPSLEWIDIDNIFYLPILPIPERLHTLYIRTDIHSPVPLEFTCFPSEIEEWLMQNRESLKKLELSQISHLQSLPASLESFSSLKSLGIYSLPELKSLPRMPASLEELTIRGCSARLKKRCQENIGRDWPNIKHIRHIDITARKEKKAEAQVNCNCVTSRLWSST